MTNDRRTLEDIPSIGKGGAGLVRAGITAGIVAAQEAGAGAELAVIERRAEELVLEKTWPAMHQPVFA